MASDANAAITASPVMFAVASLRKAFWFGSASPYSWPAHFHTAASDCVSDLSARAACAAVSESPG